MMSMTTIELMAKEAGEEAEVVGKVPYHIQFQEDIDEMPPFPFPNLGAYRPEGWELVAEIFCDKSGFGSAGESALTAKQLIDRLQVGMGYAIVEEGQFQVYIGEFKQVED